MQSNFLFVYGSLRSGFTSPAYQYISKYFTLIGMAKTKGFLHNLGTHPVGVSTESDNYIIGELYEIINPKSFDFAITQLDDYEGVNPESDEIALYKRSITEAFCNNKTYKAWVYWYTGNVAGQPIIAHGDLLEFLKLHH
jgi:gamma-glutamylcyclotransferase (GGCT)/AIG2-like uncharacterized protein YtfP